MLSSSYKACSCLVNLIDIYVVLCQQIDQLKLQHEEEIQKQNESHNETLKRLDAKFNEKSFGTFLY